MKPEPTVKHMKWWGWGNTQINFDISNRPHLWPYIVKTFGIENNLQNVTPPVELASIPLPTANLKQNFMLALEKIFRPDQLKFDTTERLIHAYGKSFRDLWRMRRGILSSAPDCVCYPESEQQIQALLTAANEHQVIIIPFGGGSNIVGCLEARDTQNNMVVSLDMRRMNAVLEINLHSNLATIQAGAMGPDLEAALNAKGMTLGHFPDSFEYSSLGGWVATRSAGMQSDKYGKIEDMVLALRLVTPSGIISTRTVPKSSNGIDVKHLCIGSEGILGVITEVTVQIHPLPERKEFYGFLFPDFSSGVAAMYECIARRTAPSMTRLNDADKTALSFAYKAKTSFLKTFLATCFKFYLKRIKKFDFNTACLMLVALEGDQKFFLRQKKQLTAIYRRFGGISLGASPGRAFEKGKYDFPYLRDFVMDRGIVADVSETATTWENLLPLYTKTRAAILAAGLEVANKPWCGCHISHTYQTGASLYFTFAFKQRPNGELADYLHVKKAAEDSFLAYGGTLSHHHAVGYEHMPWISEDISATGVKAIRGLKTTLDPNGIMNPGKIIPLAVTQHSLPA